MKQLRISKTLALPLDWITYATVVYGNRGTGKTSFGRVAAEEATRAGQRFCAIDLKGDWWGLKSSADGKSAGIPIVIFGGDHADVPLDPSAGAFVGETVAKLGQSCVLDFELLSKGKQIRFLAEFFEALYHHNRDPLLLLLDEAQRYAPQKPGPDEARTLGAVQDLVKLGRKHGLGPVLFTQRGAGLNKEVSELCDLLVAFRTPGSLDQERIKNWLEANATDDERKSVMGKLSGLATGTAMFASSHPELKLFGVHGVRRPETFDSSATPKVGEKRIEAKTLAAPDLAELRQKMADAIERVKAEDPKALRARIAELEEQLADEAPPPEPVEVIREVPCVDLGLLNGIRDEMLSEVARLFREATDRAVGRLDAQPADAPHERPVRALYKRDPTPEPKQLPPRSSPAATGFGAGESKILAAIAQHRTGVTREQLTVLTGYKRSSRDTYLQRLKAAGAIESNGERITVTDSGTKALGPNFARLPTGARLREHWLAELPEGEAKILGVLCKAFPRTVTRDKLSEATDYKRSSRDTYLQRLKARQLITVSPAFVVASSDLFDRGER